MNNTDFLLKQVNILRLKLLERQEKEETFNLFSILRNERDEVNLHSRRQHGCDLYDERVVGVVDY